MCQLNAPRTPLGSGCSNQCASFTIPSHHPERSMQQHTQDTTMRQRAPIQLHVLPALPSAAGAPSSAGAASVGLAAAAAAAASPLSSRVPSRGSRAAAGSSKEGRSGGGCPTSAALPNTTAGVSGGCCARCHDGCCSACPSSSILRTLSLWVDPRKRLSARLGWLTVCIVAVYLITVVVTVDQIARRIVNEQTGRAYADLAYQTSNVMDRTMFERWREAQNVAALPQVYNNSGDASLLNIRQENFADYAWMGITNKQGIVVASTQHLLNGVNVSTRPWFLAGSRGLWAGDLHDAVLLASLLPALPNGEPQRFLDIACPLYLPSEPGINCSTTADPAGCAAADLAQRFNGVLGFHLSWRWAESLRDQVLRTANVGASVQLLILNSDGQVLLGHEEEADVRNRIVAGTTMDNEAVQEAREGHNGYAVVSFQDGAWLTGYAASVGYSTYPGLGWLVLVRQPRDEALAPALYLQRVIVLVVLLVGAALVAMMVCAIRVSARPLQDMARTADAITEQVRQQTQQAFRKTGTSTAVQLLGSDAAAFGAKQQQLQPPQHQLQAYPSSSSSSSFAPIHVSLPPTHRRDEVGHLGASFSALLHVLNTQRAELQGVNAQLEAKMQSRTVELEMINRELEMFSQTVSHDLRAPLGSIRSIAELLAADLAPTSPPRASVSSSQRTVSLSSSSSFSGVDSGGGGVSLPPAVRATVDEYLSQIQSDVTTMSGLITDLLELSRINHSSLRLKRVNLAELAQSIVTDLQRHDVARAQHVTVLLPTPSSVEKAAAGSVRNTPLARQRALSPVHVKLSNEGNNAVAAAASDTITQASRGAAASSSTSPLTSQAASKPISASAPPASSTTAGAAQPPPLPISRAVSADAISCGGSGSGSGADVDSTFTVLCDEGLVRVVLTNLLGNSWKYTSKTPHAIIEFGSVGLVERSSSEGTAASPSSTCSGSSSGIGGSNRNVQRRAFFVRDNGAGFEMTHARRLFQPFQRMHTQAEFSGTGVGLSTVSRCCQRHGGRVWAKSAVGRGATFFFTLGPLESNEGALGAGGDGTGTTMAGAPVQLAELPPLPSVEAVLKMKEPQPNLDAAATAPLIPRRPPSPSMVAEGGPEQLSPVFAWSPTKGDISPIAASGGANDVVRFHEAKEDNGALQPTLTTALSPSAAGPTSLAPSASSASAGLRSTLQGASLSASSGAGAGPAEPSEVRQPRVLFVDDSFVLTKLGSRILSSNGVLVDTAGDGTEVLRKLYPDYHIAAESDGGDSAPFVTADTPLGASGAGAIGVSIGDHDGGDGGQGASTDASPTSPWGVEPQPPRCARKDGNARSIAADGAPRSSDANLRPPLSSDVLLSSPSQLLSSGVGRDAGVSQGLSPPVVPDMLLSPVAVVAAGDASPSASDAEPLSPGSQHSRALSHVGDTFALHALSGVNSPQLTGGSGPGGDLAVDAVGPRPLHLHRPPPRLHRPPRYDLIFCDLSMSPMDGLTCVGTLRHLGYPGRIVALTGFDDPSKRAECLRAGFDDFLAKPFTAAALMATLNEHKGKRSNYKCA